jgi:hypothetical protein
MGRHSKIIKLLLILFAAWFMGSPGYFGYTLLNDADFPLALPQLENPDLDAFPAAVKNHFSSTAPLVPDVGYLQTNGFSFYSLLEMGCPNKITPILRC